MDWKQLVEAGTKNGFKELELTAIGCQNDILIALKNQKAVETVKLDLSKYFEIEFKKGHKEIFISEAKVASTPLQFEIQQKIK